MKPRIILQGHTQRVHSLVFSPDGTTLASGSLDDTIRLWDVATGKCAATLGDKFTYSLHFSPDGKTLATVHSLEIGLWDMASRKRRTLRDDKWVYQCIRFLGSFSSDGKLLAVGGPCFADIGIWDVKSGKLLRLLEEKSVEGYRLFTDLKFTPDGKDLLAYGSTVGLRKWDVATGKSLHVVDLPEPFRTPDKEHMLQAAFSPDCKLLAVSIPAQHAKKDGQLVEIAPTNVTVLDVTTGKSTATFRGFTENAWYLTFSTDGKMLAAGRDDVASLWDIATSRKIGSFKTADNEIHAMAFSPDGKTLAIGYEKNSIQLWDVQTRK